MFKALRHQEPLQCAYTGGTVFHTFLGEQLSSWQQARDLVRTIATRYKVPYVSLTPTFSVCPNHGYLTGEVRTCKHCGEVCLIYSRIVGYYRPTKDWNVGKKKEFSKRKYYRIDDHTNNNLIIPTNIASKIKIGAFLKQTVIDFPGRIASMMFTQGCNMHCPWCHNKNMTPTDQTPTLDEIVRYVGNTEHKNLVISGGEPTVQAGLLDFLRELKKDGPAGKLNIRVKLDTNGSNPEILEQIIAEGLVDHIAMDVKCTVGLKYKKVTGCDIDPDLIRQSIGLIKSSEVPHTFRTTVVPDLVDMEDIANCRNEIGCGENLVLQAYRSVE